MPHSTHIPFNLPARTGTEPAHIAKVLEKLQMTAGRFHHSCNQWLQLRLGRENLLLTPSCTHALEICALLLDCKPGDEIILPSFTFVSTANAFAMHGATPVFVDIRPDTMNIDEAKVEAAITPRTRAIVAVHYAGVSCDMEALSAIAHRHGIMLIEDAAHALLARYRGKPLGTLGSLGAISFHETKNITSGEGGCLIVNDESLMPRADIMQHKGTNRTAFLRHQADRYSWCGLGSSWSMGELAAAYLYGNLQSADAIHAHRLHLWNKYHTAFAPLAERGKATLPTIPEGCEHNASIYYLKLENLAERNAYIDFMKAGNINTVFHYVPLHSSPAGLRYGRFHGEDRYTTAESEKLVRLPLYYNLADPDAERVIAATLRYFGMA